MTQSIERISDAAQHYDFFLVDQFGVLHDGRVAYPGAADALRQLRDAGKTVIIISNSGKRASVNQQRLNQLGFDDNCFSAVVTSGEVGWHRLRQSLMTGKLPKNARCLLWSNDNDQSAVEGLDLTLVSESSSADIVLLSGLGRQRDTLQNYQRRLQAAAAREVTCYCTNPDKIQLTAMGKQFSVGAVADSYASMGGNVVWIGKPYAEIYRFIRDNHGIENNARVLCVGDSVEHDIAGGHNMGYHTLLVRTGVLDDLGSAAIQLLCEQHGCELTYTLQRFG